MTIGRVAHRGWEAIDPDVRRHFPHMAILGVSQIVGQSSEIKPIVDDGRTPVLCVHGLGGSAANFSGLRGYLWLKGTRRVFSVSIPGSLQLEEMAQVVSAAIAQVGVVCGQSGDRSLDVVAHSQGGVVATLACLDPNTRRRIRRLITMGSPLKGTHLARFATTTVGLRPGSDLLARLEEALEHRDRPDLVCYWSRSDVLMLPPETATWPTARNIELPGCTHYGYLVHPRTWRSIYRVLAS